MNRSRNRSRVRSDDAPLDYDSNYQYPEDVHDYNHFHLVGAITPACIHAVIEWIIRRNDNAMTGAIPTPARLALIVNSGGGDLSAAFALCSVIKSSHIPIHTIAMGEIASAALIIFLAGAERIIAPNTSIMSHNYTWEPNGDMQTIKNDLVEVDLISARYANFVADQTGMTVSQVKELLIPQIGNIWLDISKALEYRIAHRESKNVMADILGYEAT